MRHHRALPNAASALALLTILSAAGLGGDAPNLVLIMTDDQGYGDLSFTGNPVLETPNMDRLAREGARLNRFYVCPVCSPTRAGLMTGRYHYRTRVVDTWVGRSNMEPEEVTVAELLADAGYHTGIFGKWHLGDCHPMRPIDQGFAESLVHFGGGLAQPSEPPENERRYTNPILSHNGREVPTEGYCTDVYFEAASRFIDQHRGSGRPFFVYLPTNAPHSPLHDVPEALYEKYRALDLSAADVPAKQRDATARKYAMIENVDQNVGRLLDRLGAWGLAENTLVVFMLDNGPQGARYNAGLRGQKSHVYEGGIRSVFFARWPARLTAGHSSDHTAGYVDVLPTLLEAAGLARPPGLRLDGRSVLPLLEGAPEDWPERILYLQAHRGDAPQRGAHFAAVGPRYKLVRNSGFGGPRSRGHDDSPAELFDLDADPGEQHDLAAELPEVVQQMRGAYERWFADVSSTRPDNFTPPRIVLGASAPAFTRLSKQDWRVEEDGGWGRGGTWRLRLTEAGTYRVTLLSLEELRGTAQIAFLGRPDPGTGATQGAVSGLPVTRTRVLSRARQRVVFDGVELGPGDVDLRASIRLEQKELGVHQVLMERL